MVALASGIAVGLLAGLYAISFAYVVFTPALGAHIREGIGFALYGAVAVTLLSCFRKPFVGTIWQPQSVVVVMLGIAVSHILAQNADLAPEVQFATVSGLVVVTTLTTGALMGAIGLARLGRIAKYIPYPVIGGFMAATGYFLLLRAVHFGAGNGGGLSDFVELSTIQRWAPPVGLAGVMLLAERWIRPAAVLIIGALGYYLLTLAGIWAAGMTPEAARAAKILLEITPSETGRLCCVVSADLLRGADWGIILGQGPMIATAAALAVLGMLMNLTAIEYSNGEPIEQNAELRLAGLANLLSGFGGGLVGYPSATLSHLSASLVTWHSRVVPIASAVTLVAMLVAGPALLNWVPRGLFALLLGYLGFGFLKRWLIVEYARMPRIDYLILLLILCVTVVVGFAWALLLGVILASVRFTVAYSRVPVVRGEMTGALRLSSTERSEHATRLLVEHGDETLIVETQGYMFFGTVNSLFSRVMEALDRHSAEARPVRNLIVDFRHVQGVDISAMFMFDRLARQAAKRDVALVFTDLGPTLQRQFERGVRLEWVRFLPTLDAALVEREEAVLARATAGGAQHADLSGYDSGVGPLLERILASGVSLDVRREGVAAGTLVLEKGRMADSLILLEEGRLFATVESEAGATVRVATFLPGAVVGEIGFITGEVRSASVIAETDSTLVRLTRADLDRLKKHAPALALEFAEVLARLVALRLTRTTALLRAVSR